jgi:Cytochrome C oxidase, cbb3-type, subunit III
MNKYLFLFMLIVGAAQADQFAAGNADNGKKLFARYECDSCHKGKVGGDGSAIFTRPDRIVRTVDELIPRIKFCSGAVGANLKPQEELDLAAHLNQTYYHFK